MPLKEKYPWPIEKALWGDGPWQQELDYYEYNYRGYPLRILRGPSGSLNGYVGCSLTKHPDLLHDHDDYDVHGGITYAQEEDGLFWLGFDTAHFMDQTPAYALFHTGKAYDIFLEKNPDVSDATRETFKILQETNDKLVSLEKDSAFHRQYRTHEYVLNELHSLVAQLIAAEKGPLAKIYYKIKNISKRGED